MRIIGKYEEDVIICDGGDNGGDGDDHGKHDVGDGHNNDHVSMKMISQLHLLNSIYVADLIRRPYSFVPPLLAPISPWEADIVTFLHGTDKETENKCLTAYTASIEMLTPKPSSKDSQATLSTSMLIAFLQKSAISPESSRSQHPAAPLRRHWTAVTPEALCRHETLWSRLCHFHGKYIQSMFVF